VCGRDAVDGESDAIGFGEMEEAANVVVLVVGRKKALGFHGGKPEGRKGDELAEVAGERAVKRHEIA